MKSLMASNFICLKLITVALWDHFNFKNGISFLSTVCLSPLYRSCKYMIRKANTGPNLPHGDKNRIMEVCNLVSSCLFNLFLFLSNLSF